MPFHTSKGVLIAQDSIEPYSSLVFGTALFTFMRSMMVYTFHVLAQLPEVSERRVTDLYYFFIFILQSHLSFISLATPVNCLAFLPVEVTGDPPTWVDKAYEPRKVVCLWEVTKITNSTDRSRNPIEQLHWHLISCLRIIGALPPNTVTGRIACAFRLVVISMFHAKPEHTGVGSMLKSFVKL